MAAQLEGRLEGTILRPGKRSAEVSDFETKLRSLIVGQDDAVTELVNVYQAVSAGLATPGRPIANLLFLGPTGSGKTRLVEAASEILFGTADAVIKIDCAEFQHSHEIAKLIGSPPGYIGHRETPALLTQESVDRYHNEKHKFTLLLFDEIEKASDALWQLLLGILDKGTLTLGDNRKVNLSRAIIFMTSNLGAYEIARAMSGGIGFAPPSKDGGPSQIEHKIYRVAVEAAKRRFSPEFMNRIDKVLVFQPLDKSDLEKILDIELRAVQNRILLTQLDCPFALTYSPTARQFLLKEGTDMKYGARPLKRAIEHHLIMPLSALLATDQIIAGDTVNVHVEEGTNELMFSSISPMLRSAAAAAGSPVIETLVNA